MKSRKLDSGTVLVFDTGDEVVSALRRPPRTHGRKFDPASGLALIDLDQK